MGIIKHEIVVGTRIGNRTVLREVPKAEANIVTRDRIVEVECDCGAIDQVGFGNFRQDKGSCFRCAKSGRKQLYPIVPGTRYWPRTIIREDGHISGHRAALVRCDCGEERRVEFFKLRNGSVRRCAACVKTTAAAKAAERAAAKAELRRARDAKAAEQLREREAKAAGIISNCQFNTKGELVDRLLCEGLSQSDISRLLGVSRQHVHQIVRQGTSTGEQAKAERRRENMRLVNQLLDEGFSQSDIGRLLGVSRQRIHQIVSANLTTIAQPETAAQSSTKGLFPCHSKTYSD